VYSAGRSAGSRWRAAAERSPRERARLTPARWIAGRGVASWGWSRSASWVNTSTRPWARTSGWTPASPAGSGTGWPTEGELEHEGRR